MLLCLFFELLAVICFSSSSREHTTKDSALTFSDFSCLFQLIDIIFSNTCRVSFSVMTWVLSLWLTMPMKTFGLLTNCRIMMALLLET